jgi:hypothetical protein
VGAGTIAARVFILVLKHARVGGDGRRNVQECRDDDETKCDVEMNKAEARWQG